MIVKAPSYSLNLKVSDSSQALAVYLRIKMKAWSQLKEERIGFVSLVRQ